MQKVIFSSRNGTLNIKYKIVQKDPNMKGLTYCQLASATGAGKKMTNITSGTAVRDESWNCFHPRRSIPDKRKRVTSSVYAVSVRETTRNPSVHHESCIFVWKWCPDRNYISFFFFFPLLCQTFLSFPCQLSAFLPMFPLTLPNSSICVPQHFLLLPALLVIIGCPAPLCHHLLTELRIKTVENGGNTLQAQRK